MTNTNLKIIIFLCLISFGLSDLVSAGQKFQRVDHFSRAPQIIDFIYDEPIDGVRISGRYTLNEWEHFEYDLPRETYRGMYKGSAEITFTRLSDMRSITEIFDNVSFLNTYHCQNKEPIYGCLLEYPLSLEPVDYRSLNLEYVEVDEGRFEFVRGDDIFFNFLPDVGVKIVDYDYDDKNEIIFIMPYEYRTGPEFLIYELIDTKEEFRISMDHPRRIPFTIEFDYENKTMKYSYSNGYYRTNYYLYKANNSNGYTLVYKKHSCDFIDIQQFDAERKKNMEEWCLDNNK